VLFSDEAESEAIGFAVAVGVLGEFFGDGVEFVPVLGRGGDSGLLEEALVVDELDGVSEPGVGVECSVEEAEFPDGLVELVVVGGEFGEWSQDAGAGEHLDVAVGGFDDVGRVAAGDLGEEFTVVAGAAEETD